MIGRKEKIGVFAIILASLLACGVSAVPQIPQNFLGTVRLGGTTAPAGVLVTANWSNSTTSYSWNDTTDSSGQYVIAITFDDTDTTNTTEGCPSGSTVRFWVGGTNIRNSTATAGGATQASFDLNASASCSDGVTNQNETFVDCGGECTACYALSVSPTTISETILPNASTTATLTITNAGVYGLTNLTVSAPTLAGGNITINFTAPNSTLAAGASRIVTLNISVSNGTVENLYTGTINVTARNSTSNRTVSLSISTAESTSMRRRTSYMDWNITSAAADKYCIGKAVTVTVIRDKDKEPIKDVDIDIYLAGKKVFYLMTDANGQASFTPAAAGSYTVSGQRTRYKDLEEVISVVDCAPAVTTTVAAKPTTTVKPAVTTTVEAKPTTTVKPPVTTTVAKAATTVPVAAPAEKKGMNWTLIIGVIVVIIVVAVVLSKKGGSGGAAPKK